MASFCIIRSGRFGNFEVGLWRCVRVEDDVSNDFSDRLEFLLWCNSVFFFLDLWDIELEFPH